ncbi:MAG: PIN domain-containing protein, partial [Candidatus Binatia bacterium]
SDILQVEGELDRKIWYDRHLQLRHKVETGQIKIVDETSSVNVSNEITKTIWKGALSSARKIEKQFGLENLGPWDDFEWGMINGKLSAIRFI